MKKIGLIDVDGHSGFPNLALMKISAWHKAQGDHVEWWIGLSRYHRVYMSKVFTFTPDIDFVIQADEIVRGGTGYRSYDDLSPEMEKTKPDYTLYPQCDYAIGFLTRGCIRSCSWCIVPKKEGSIRPAATWQEIKRPDSKKIVFLDNNVLAHEHGLRQIEELGHERIWVDFNQGLDARLIDHEIAGLLSKLHWIRFIRFSCDTSEMIPIINNAVSYLRMKGVSKSRFWAYMLVKDDLEEAESRALALEDMGVIPFAQPYRDYDGGEPTENQKNFARWVNNRAVFKSCSFKEYRGRKAEDGEKDM